MEQEGAIITSWAHVAAGRLLCCGWGALKGGWVHIVGPDWRRSQRCSSATLEAAKPASLLSSSPPGLVELEGSGAGSGAGLTLKATPIRGLIPPGSRCCSFGLTWLKQRPVLTFDPGPGGSFVLELSTKLLLLPGRRNSFLFNRHAAQKNDLFRLCL